MPTPRAFQAVSLAPKPKRRGRPPKKKIAPRQKQLKTRSNASNAKVSQATRDRLIADALQSPAYEGMEPAEVAALINQKIDAYIANYPWWYGGLSTDRPKRERTEAQRMAFEKVRQRKAEIQQEVEAPYVPTSEASSPDRLDKGTD